jgi:hypothetical protein
MPIRVPGPRLARNVGLAFVERSVGGGRRALCAGLALTSMIDILVVVVVFLLLNFSASGECCIRKPVFVPSACNVDELLDAPLIGVDGMGAILIDGSPVGTTHAILEDNRVERLDDLFNVLAAKRELWRALYPDRTPPGLVIIEMDRDTPAVVLKSIVATSARAGFPQTSFMVNALRRDP